MRFNDRDLTEQYISLSYQDVLQQYVSTGSYVYILDGYGNVISYIPTSSIGQALITADQIPDTASYAFYAKLAGTASQAFSASYSETAVTSSVAQSVCLSQSVITSQIGSVQPPYTPATIWWDDNAKTYAIYSDHEGVSLQIGQESWLRVLAHENIPNGSAVYVASAKSGYPCAMLALADGLGESTRKYAVIGVATEYISSGSMGIVTTAGQVHDLDLSTYTIGNPIWLSDVQSGSFVNTPPHDPAEKVIVGYVLTNTSGSSILQVSIVGEPNNSYPFIGFTTVPTITQTGGNTFSVSTSSVNLSETANGFGTIKNYILQSSSFNINTGSLLTPYYLCADYNSGTPIYVVTQDKTTIDSIQRTICYTMTPGAGGSVSFVSWDAPGNLLANKLFNRQQKTSPIVRESGLTLYESASKGIAVTTGTAWVGINSITLPEVNSSQSRFVLLVHSGSSWSSSLITSASNYMCDDGTGLVPLSNNNRYVVNYIYRGVGSLNTTVVMLSPEYSTLTLAQQAQPPTPPSSIFEITLMVGRMIYQRNSATATQVDSAFTNVFVPAGVSVHNDLSGLQGGKTGEYYHLTAAQHSTVGVYVQSASIADQAVSSSWASSSVSASYAELTSQMKAFSIAMAIVF